MSYIFKVDTLLDERYRIIELIESGGYAEVYKAKDIKLEREVAIKVLQKISPEEVDTFMREALTIAHVKFDYIVEIYDVGSFKKGHMFQKKIAYPYMVLEYADGGSLETKLEKHGAYELIEMIPIVRQICEAVAFAHNSNLIHRDIKPGNILFTKNGRVKVADFGLVTVLQPFELYASAAAIGTPEYAAPEQAQGIVSTASDQFAVAAIVFVMLTGVSHFNSKGWENLKAMPEVRRVLEKVLKQDYTNRYTDVLTFFQEFEKAANQTKPAVVASQGIGGKIAHVTRRFSGTLSGNLPSYETKSLALVKTNPYASWRSILKYFDNQGNSSENEPADEYSIILQSAQDTSHNEVILGVRDYYRFKDFAFQTLIQVTGTGFGTVFYRYQRNPAEYGYAVQIMNIPLLPKMLYINYVQCIGGKLTNEVFFNRDSYKEIHSGTAFVLGVVCVGSRMEFYIDKNLVCSVDDLLFGSGHIALRCSTTKFNTKCNIVWKYPRIWLKV